jgi:hypothetical protein
MTIVQNRFLILSAVANGDIESTFILDTGAGLEVVSSKFFERIRDTAVPAGIATGFQSIGARVDLKLYRIPSLQIGSLTRTGMIIAPYTGLDSLDPIDGFVSLKFFEGTPFTLDFISGKLTLESDASLRGLEATAEVIPLLEQRDRDVALSVYVPLLVNGTLKIQAEFDTGTGVETMINPYFLKALGIDTGSPEATVSEFTNPDGKPQEMIQAPLASLALAHSCLVRETDVEATFLKDFIYEGLIGWQLFRNYLITIDLPNLRLLVRENAERLRS